MAESIRIHGKDSLRSPFDCIILTPRFRFPCMVETALAKRLRGALQVGRVQLRGKEAKLNGPRWPLVETAMRP